MKKSLIVILIILGLLLTGAFIYWQNNKKSIVSDSIGSAVTKKTDNLYYINYDSSSIDEINGNASFYNIRLQSDSIETRIKQADSSDNIMYDIMIKEVSVKGTDVAGLLTGNFIEANSVIIVEPVIRIIQIRGDNFSKNDSLAIYEKMLGNFKSIKAEKIIIQNGTVLFSKKLGPPDKSLKGIDISLSDFKVDSTKDYENLASYFIKGLTAKVKEAIFKYSNSSTLSFNDVSFNASEQSLHILNFLQTKGGKLVTRLNNISITGLSTNAFIYRQDLIADHLSTDGGVISVYRKKSGRSGNIELDSSFFDNASVNRISVGNTKVIIININRITDPPLEINNVKFSATSIPVISEGSRLKNIIAKSNWILSGDGISILSDDKIYKLIAGNFKIDKQKRNVFVNSFSMVPQISEVAFVKTRKVQQDFYDLRISDIEFINADIDLFINEGVLAAESVKIKPVLKIFSDRTLPADPRSKVGKYPQQSLVNLDQKLNIKKLLIANGNVTYKERGAISEQVGSVYFNNIKGTITNLTNIKSLIDAKPLMTASIAASFMGKSNLTSTWNFPLNAPDGSFSLDGKLGPLDMKVLNPAFEPLGMASVKEGRIKSLDFKIDGNDFKAQTSAMLIYEDLKIEVLRKESDNDLQRRTAISILANLIIKNSNPSGGETRKNQIEMKRELNRSFFHLAWKSLFKSAKKTATGKNNL